MLVGDVPVYTKTNWKHDMWQQLAATQRWNYCVVKHNPRLWLNPWICLQGSNHGRLTRLELNADIFSNPLPAFTSQQSTGATTSSPNCPATMNPRQCVGAKYGIRRLLLTLWYRSVPLNYHSQSTHIRDRVNRLEHDSSLHPHHKEHYPALDLGSFQLRSVLLAGRAMSSLQIQRYSWKEPLLPCRRFPRTPNVVVGSSRMLCCSLEQIDLSRMDIMRRRFY